MHNNLVFLFFLVISMLKGHGQQSPVFADYNFNSILINPAFAGYYSDIDIALGHSQYLSDIEGSPQTFGANINLPLREQKMGLGLGIMADEIGVLKTTTVTASYAYHLPFKRSIHDGRKWIKTQRELVLDLREL